jgi:hypothetical protein
VKQEVEPGAAGFEDGGGLSAFVAGEILGDDHVAAAQSWGALRLDIGLEDIPVDRPIDDPLRGQAILAQRCKRVWVPR